MMNYETFKEAVKESILDYMPEKFKEMEVATPSTTKVNETLDGLTLRSNKTRIAPTIYINDMYERYQKSGDFGKTLEEACEALKVSYDNMPSVDVDRLFDNAAQKVVFQLINTEQNKLLLTQIPHREFEDLSIIYRVVISCNTTNIANVMVTNELAEKLGMDEVQLFKLAVENTKRILPPRVRSMNDIMKEIISAEHLELTGMMEEIPDNQMQWVISNNIGINGAASLLYEDVLHELAEKLESNLYILPSSVHEVIAVCTDEWNPEELANMVAEINMETVILNERLSNQVYHYDKELRVITCATDTSNKSLDRIEI